MPAVVASLRLITCVGIRVTALDVVNCTVRWNFHLCARLRAAFSKPLLSGTCTQSLLLPRLLFGFIACRPCIAVAAEFG